MHWIKNKEEKYFRLLERVYPEPRLKCGLADSSEGSEKGQCRACTFKIGEFEFDDVLEQLIRNGQIRNPPRSSVPVSSLRGHVAGQLG
jgi:hypothetical protein